MVELSLNERAWRVADEMEADAAALGIAMSNVAGARIIDAGAKTRGSIAAGVLTAAACLADLGEVSLQMTSVGDASLPAVMVDVRNPVAACLASQYAGWQINVEKYFAMGSGPMRAAYAKEELFADISHTEKPRCVVGILETSKLPTAEVVQYIADRCKVATADITLVVARTASLVGGTQVVARSVETALHKLHELKFDLSRIVGGVGIAPLPPVAKDDLAAIGRTNDAVLYGAQVSLYVTGDDDSLQTVGKQLPSDASKDYGKPFGELFASYGHDFYKIDPMLFSPAKVTLQNVDTGKVHTFGKLNHEVLKESFGA